jgi:hypothetical protein
MLYIFDAMTNAEIIRYRLLTSRSPKQNLQSQTNCPMDGSHAGAGICYGQMVIGLRLPINGCND